MELRITKALRVRVGILLKGNIIPLAVIHLNNGVCTHYSLAVCPSYNSSTIINSWGVKLKHGRGGGTREEGELFPWFGSLLRVWCGP